MADHIEDMEQAVREGQAFRIVWSHPPDMPVQFVNRFLVQRFEGDIVLSMGILKPPPLLGTDEEKRAQAASIEHLQINIVGQYGFTADRLRELARILNQVIEQVDAARGAEVRDE